MFFKSFLSFILLFIVLACQNTNKLNSNQSKSLTDEQKQYWYEGEAEITSFKIEQARYGEMRTGNAVMIFVTEDFSRTKFTKTIETAQDKISVLKMNFTKNFTTGIYPYSIMTSSFLPFLENSHVLKISNSIQEWCGHVYMELIREKKYSISISSYFEDESVDKLALPIVNLEDELWSKIRIDPKALPVGKIEMIPSCTFLRFMHLSTEAYECDATLSQNDSTSSYKLVYPKLERNLLITFSTKFPYEILSWEEEYLDGSGDNKTRLKSTGTRIKTIKSSYWSKNKNIDQPLRNELGLE